MPPAVPEMPIGPTVYSRWRSASQALNASISSGDWAGIVFCGVAMAIRAVEILVQEKKRVCVILLGVPIQQVSEALIKNKDMACVCLLSN
ncbi:hypothetical protein [Noviherbaspirillum humi]|uniref:hypothetical protein n=1 Tax=Noviherbaspirillum humi TaxID=1688639 RepID=UPI0011604505|nr:hypothetical protein [Noviherbaspirillum humi]